MSLPVALRPVTLFAGLALLVSFGAVNPLRANVIYDFTGACTDCYGGAGNGTATLVLQDTYTPGNAVNLSDLISFDYHGTDLLAAYTITPANASFMNGTLPVSSGPANFQVSGCISSCGNGDVIAYFTSAVDGTWSINIGPLNTDFGTNGNFSTTATPEPSSVLLIGAGLAGLATLRRRQR